ncbi:HAD family hydrolase [Xanthobacter aminoxidans]|uniref:HAD family hydrolase n=1 Tax=Xanthobacter aminoxidans TaxID=186280 RepID=UPI003728AA6A
MKRLYRVLAIIGALAFSTIPALCDSLASWKDGAARSAIEDFVRRVTDPASKDFVPPERRIAVFDNDGTLWVEQPMYTQLAFALARIKELAPQHPEWQANPVLKAAIDGDMKTLATSGEKGLLELVMVTHAGMTPDEFQANVTDWLAKAEHPRFKKPYTALVYQPMLELLAYLRENGFTTYIVSGGGIEFMRPWAKDVYGVLPSQVVGSSIKTKFEMVDGKPALLRLPDVNFVDDGPGKPVGINQHIGQRPIAAFGNSDGDLQMLQWTTSGEGPRLGMIVHHTDAEREYAYDRASSFGHLDKAMDRAQAEGWVLIDMKSDWKTVFPSAR